MTKLLIKVYDKTCDICEELAGLDESLADDRGFEFVELELAELALFAPNDPFRGYIVNVHVSPEDGMVDVPIYAIVNNGSIQASGSVKSLEELTNIIDSWEVWLKSQSSVEQMDSESKATPGPETTES